MLKLFWIPGGDNQVKARKSILRAFLNLKHPDALSLLFSATLECNFPRMAADLNNRHFARVQQSKFDFMNKLIVTILMAGCIQFLIKQMERGR